MMFFSTFLDAEVARELVLLHTNDMHARVVGVKANDTMCSFGDREGHDCFGGFDRIYTQVQAERTRHQNVLLLDAGDQFQGTMFHLLYHGLASARFMNRIGYDAMAVGNHEFDNGPGILAEFIKEMKFPLLSANIDVSKSVELKGKIKPYVIMNKNGLRIGLVGYTTEDTAYLSSPGPNVKFLRVIESVKKAVADLKRAKADVIIAISHAGLKKDIEVARSVDGIAAIVCGHTNSLLSNNQKNADGPSPLVVRSPAHHPVLLVSAYAYGKFLGKLWFSFDARGIPLAWQGEPIMLDHKVARDAAIGRDIEKLYQPILDFEKQKVGAVPVDIDGQVCRFEECIFGNLIADSMLEFARKFGVQIAFMNGGGIRASIPKGPVNQAQLKDVLPFEKTLVLLKVKGSVVRQIIEHGVAFVDDRKNDNTGRFLQVAGLKYSFDPRKPRGKRVIDIAVIDASTNKTVPLDLTKIYGVATNNYLVEGGDNFTFFAESGERWSMALELKDLLGAFFQTALSQLPKREGRIVNVAMSQKPPLNISRIN